MIPCCSCNAVLWLNGVCAQPWYCLIGTRGCWTPSSLTNLPQSFQSSKLTFWWRCLSLSRMCRLRSVLQHILLGCLRQRIRKEVAVQKTFALQSYKQCSTTCRKYLICLRLVQLPEKACSARLDPKKMSLLSSGSPEYPVFATTLKDVWRGHKEDYLKVPIAYKCFWNAP